MIVSEIQTTVSSNLGDPSTVHFTTDAINAAIQDAYNLVFARTLCFQKSILIPQIPNQVYYPLLDYIPDLLAVSAIFNWATKKWLSPVNRLQFDAMRWDWELMNGEPQWFDPQNFRYTAIVPHNAKLLHTGFEIFYRAKADKLSPGSVPVIPPQTTQVLEFYATKDQFESIREFTKAQEYKSMYEGKIPQIKQITRRISFADKANTLGGDILGMYGFDGSITDPWEIPSGFVDGTNATFTLTDGPIPEFNSTLLLLKNNIVQVLNTDFIFSDPNTVIFANPPSIGDIIVSWNNPNFVN